MVSALKLTCQFHFLPAYSSFLEWNSDPEIAEVAEHLYSNIENLELYVGLQAEEAKPVVDGAGLCPGRFRSVIHFGGFTYFLSRVHHQSRNS